MSQVVAAIWNDKCVGKLYETMTECAPPLEGVYNQRWKGEVLGHEVDAKNLDEAFRTVHTLGKKMGLLRVKLVKDEGYEVVMPAFEE